MHPCQPLTVDHTQSSSHSASRNLLVLTFKCSHQVLAPAGSPGNHRLALILCVCSPDFKVAVCLPTSVLCQVQETSLILLLLILENTLNVFINITFTTGFLVYVLFSCPVMSDSLWPQGRQHTRPSCPSLSPEFAQVHVHCISDAIQPCHALMPSSPSALNLSQHQGLFQ